MMQALQNANWAAQLLQDDVPTKITVGATPVQDLEKCNCVRYALGGFVSGMLLGTHQTP